MKSSSSSELIIAGIQPAPIANKKEILFVTDNV